LSFTLALARQGQIADYPWLISGKKGKWLIFARARGLL